MTSSWKTWFLAFASNCHLNLPPVPFVWWPHKSSQIDFKYLLCQEGQAFLRQESSLRAWQQVGRSWGTNRCPMSWLHPPVSDTAVT